MDLFNYLVTHVDQVLELLVEHIQLTGLAVLVSILIGVPIGILIAYKKSFRTPVMGFVNFLQAIPSMALLGFAIPLLGIGAVPAIVVVFLYSLLPIVKNTYIGISQINPETIEAAKGIGMTKWQILKKVQLPLTLPVLMGGVRISAVTAVGLMTIAAFIGAGGLGFLVFSGISTVNNGMIVAGALPACILALVIDYILSLVEDLVTPISLQAGALKVKDKVIRQRRIKAIAVGLAAVAMFGFFGQKAYTSFVEDKSVITIGGKQFTEQSIMVEMLKEYIESHTNIKVKTKPGIGGTQVVFNAIKKGEIDMAVDYTGTIYGQILQHDLSKEKDKDKVYSTIKREMKDNYNLVILDQSKFNNTYTLAVTQETAKKYNLEMISDLVDVASTLKAGFTMEFMNRSDGLPGLAKDYNLTFKDAVGIDGATRYVALINGESQVIDSFSTEGLLKKYELKVLKDDKNFFPGYYCVPVVRNEIIEAHPELKGVLKILFEQLDDETMKELNYKVDGEQRDPKAVAHEFLTSKGLI